MIYIVILLLGLLWAGNHALSRNLLYPPALYSAVWMLSLAGLVLSGDTFYAVSAETLMVFFVGALAFSVGGLLVFRGGASSQARHVSFTPIRLGKIHGILDFVLVVALVGLPFYWRSVTVDGDLSDPLFFATQRALAVEAAESAQQSYNPLANLVGLALFLAMAMHWENDGRFSRRWRAYLAILLALIYGATTGNKGNAVTLILTLVFISFARVGRLNVLVLGITLAFVLLLFAGLLLLVNLAYMDLGVSLETFRILSETIQNYWLGGLVAFERVVQVPASLESAHHLNRFFVETANSLGASISIPSIHPDYTSISPSQDTNVYTIYFSYFKDLGWLGVVLGMSMLGAVLVLIYRFAQSGNPIAVIFYAMTATSIILSIQAEHFVLALNFYIKGLLFFYIVYYGFSRFSVLGYSYQGRRSA